MQVVSPEEELPEGDLTADDETQEDVEEFPF
jgi:hypothetical protein